MMRGLLYIVVLLIIVILSAVAVREMQSVFDSGDSSPATAVPPTPPATTVPPANDTPVVGDTETAVPPTPPPDPSPTPMPTPIPTATPSSPTPTPIPTIPLTLPPPPATKQLIGRNVYQGLQLGLPPPAGENAAYVANGDIDGTGTCHMRVFGPGEPLANLSAATWELSLISGGTPEQRQALIDGIQRGAEADPNAGGSCPFG